MTKRNCLRFIIATLAPIASVQALAQAPDGIPGVLAPGAVPELVQEGFVFTEGPLGTADGGLYFSDIRVSKVFYIDASGKTSLVRENTNGANGLALTRDGELLFAEGEGKRISKRDKDGSITTITEGPSGIPLLSPNDLLVDNKGGIYFTDPGPRPVVPGRPPSSSGCGVEEEVDRGDFALADDDEIDAGIGGWTFRWAGYPVDATRVVQLLRRGGRRVAEVRVGRPDHASDPIDLVTSAMDGAGFVKHGVLGENLVDRRAPALGVALAETRRQDCVSAASKCSVTWLDS